MCFRRKIAQMQVDRFYNRRNHKVHTPEFLNCLVVSRSLFKDTRFGRWIGQTVKDSGVFDGSIYGDSIGKDR